MELVLGTACGCAGALASLFLGGWLRWIRREGLLAKILLELGGGALVGTVTFIALWSRANFWNGAFAFAVGMGWSAVVQHLRMRITTTVRSKIEAPMKDPVASTEGA